MNFLKSHVQWFYSLVQHQIIKFGAGLALALILVGGYYFALAPPSDFPSGNIVVIARGESIADITEKLSEARVVKRQKTLQMLLHISGTSDQVQAGTYLFNAPENALTVVYRLVTGDYGIPPVRITFPEGVTVRDMAERVVGALPLISAQDFISAAKSEEGYLFPDTYLFHLDTNAKSIIETMRANFNAKIIPLTGDIKASGHSISDIIIMASMVEKEARTETNRRIVAGILWNRLSLGMPLQVDAVFGYIFNRDTYSPSFEDLKVDSPYNTYIHTGLPPGPICNPGLESIKAALYPTKTNYLYYITGSDNLMHYATTYSGHIANQNKYLR